MKYHRVPRFQGIDMIDQSQSGIGVFPIRIFAHTGFHSSRGGREELVGVRNGKTTLFGTNGGRIRRIRESRPCQGYPGKAGSTDKGSTR